MKWCEDSKIIVEKFWKILILLFYYFVMKNVRVLKSLLKILKKVQFLCILLLCDEMMWGSKKIFAANFEI